MDAASKHLQLLLLVSVKASVNRLIKGFGFLSTKYTAPLLNVSWTATLTGICLDKYVRLSVGCSLSGGNNTSKL